MMSMKASLHEMSQNYFELLICLGNISQGLNYHSYCYLKKLFTLNRYVMESEGIDLVMRDLKKRKRISQV